MHDAPIDPDRPSGRSADERKRQIDRILEAVLDAPSGARGKLLDAMCGNDPQLLGHIQRLIEVFEQPSILDEPLEIPWSLFGPPDDERTPVSGEFVGPYRIERTIARGGMGTVYLAVREEEGFHKRVALKLMRRDHDPGVLLKRFHTEQKILAELEHPNIARLLDGGRDASGRPFFAMEYVDGKPITEFCDEHRLDIDERIRLFGTVCEAVQHAHSVPAVHRDVKPSNLLVTARGDVKLLDFGIARLLGPSQFTVTLAGVVVGTPEYAAPEQLAGGVLTTSADIYALGVVLHELLIGRVPFPIGTRSQIDWLHAVTHQDPVRPSVLLRDTMQDAESDAGWSPGAVAHNRRTTPARLQRKLSGDLDTIVLRALANEPKRRYVSAAALSDDLGRYLEGRPITARPDTVAYRLTKFVRRHALGVSLATVGVLALVITALVALFFARNASIAAERSSEVTAFLTDLFRLSDPDAVDGEQITALELLDLGASRLRNQLADQPELRSQLLLVVANVYRDLSLASRAAPLAEEALTLRADRYDSGDLRVAEAQHVRGWLHYLEGEYQIADSLLRAARETRLRELGEHDTSFARATDNLAEVLRARGQLNDAATLAEQALAVRRQQLGLHLDVAQSLNNLGVIRRQQGMLDTAETLLREALQTYAILNADGGRDALASRGNLAMVLRGRGRLTEAADVFRTLAAQQTERYGITHSLTVTSLNNLASVLGESGQLLAADSLFRIVLEQWRARGEENHPNAVVTKANLADVLSRRGLHDEAETLQREVLATFIDELGTEHVNTAIARHNLASTLLARGDAPQAEPFFREALNTLRTALPPDHALTNRAAFGLGRALAASGRCAQADSLLAAAHTTFSTDTLMRSSAGLAAFERGTCLLRLRRADDAEPLLAEAASVLQTDTLRRRQAIESLITLYAERSDTANARRYRLLLRDSLLQSSGD